MARKKKVGRSVASNRRRGGRSKNMPKRGKSVLPQLKTNPTRRSARISARMKGRNKNTDGCLAMKASVPPKDLETQLLPACSAIALAATTEYLCYSPEIKQQCWAVASLKAPFYEPTARACVDIVAVIDKSGSMRGEKIALVKKTLLFVINQLKESDRFSLVVYDQNVELIFGLMKMTKQNREKAKKYVSSIEPGTTTNLYGGLIKGMEQLALTNGGEKAQVQSVLLLTDGLANLGFTRTAQIVEQMELMQNKGLGAVTKPPSFPGAQWNSNPFVRPYQQLTGSCSIQTSQQLQQKVVQPFLKQTTGQVQRKCPPPTSKQASRQLQKKAAPAPSRQTTRQLKGKAVPPHSRQTTRQVQRQTAPTSSRQTSARQLQKQSRQTTRQLQRQAALPPSRRQIKLKAQGQPAFNQQLQRITSPSLPQPPPPLQSFQQSSGLFAQAPFGLLPSALSPSKSAEETATDEYKFDGTVYTFGFGSDHDASMLEAISTQGGGVYYYIDSNEKIPESFADCLGGLLSVMGQNMNVKLQVQGDTIFNKVHTSKSINWTKKNKSCEIALGDIQSEESRDLVLELELPPLPSGTASENVPLVSVELSYFNVITSRLDTVQCQLTTSRKYGDQGPGNVIVDVQRNRVLAAHALKKAEDLGNNNKLKEAQDILKNAVAKLQSSISRDEGFVKLLLHDLNKCLETMKTRDVFQSRGKNYMRSKLQTHRLQRSNFVHGKEGKKLEAYGYGNKSKAAYRLKAACKK